MVFIKCNLWDNMLQIDVLMGNFTLPHHCLYQWFITSNNVCKQSNMKYIMFLLLGVKKFNFSKKKELGVMK